LSISEAGPVADHEQAEGDAIEKGNGAEIVSDNVVV